MALDSHSKGCQEKALETLGCSYRRCYLLHAKLFFLTWEPEKQMVWVALRRKKKSALERWGPLFSKLDRCTGQALCSAEDSQISSKPH